MHRITPLFFLLITIFLISHKSNAQVRTVDSLENSHLNWYNKDLSNDGIPGTSVDRVYKELINGRKHKKKVIVAIIDSGVDFQHEDLEGKIWTNEDEIPGNGLDDDANGYIDDIHGWNFIGNSDGENIQMENFEYTRVYKKYHSVFNNKSISDLKKEENRAYKAYLKSKKLYEKNLAKYREEKEGISMYEEVFTMAKKIVYEDTGIAPESLEDLKKIKSDSKRTAKAVDFLEDAFKIGFSEKDLQEYKKHTEECLSKHLNLDFNPREIIGDDPTNIEDSDYGNSDVTGPRADHGTSVAGVVAANRDNIGIDGIAEGVEIMILRAVPKGDEYDKDIALAIRYAVDNGAQILNMSFGKEISPNKEFVDAAIKYAASKNVLMVHASGNSGINTDIEPRYPNDVCLDGNVVDSWIEVGASTNQNTSSIPADFSNYGANAVDIFAPGQDIISLNPEDKYDSNDGTSLASPIVTGVAALVWSYYPELTARELKEILMSSSFKVKKPKVLIPDQENEKRKKVRFNTLSVSGGIVNAYNAMKMAEANAKD